MMSLFTHQKKENKQRAVKEHSTSKEAIRQPLPWAAWWMILLIRVITAIHTEGTRESFLLLTSGRISGKNAP